MLSPQPEHRGDYAAITGQYAEFGTFALWTRWTTLRVWASSSGYQEDMFGSVSEENVASIKRQNKRKISVIIGKPPYAISKTKTITRTAPMHARECRGESAANKKNGAAVSRATTQAVLYWDNYQRAPLFRPNHA
jgi:predicted helicase